MRNNIYDIFQQLLSALHASEKRHRAVRDGASDASDWPTYDAEREVISSIIKWRRSLEPLRAEIIESGAIEDSDLSMLPISSSTLPISSSTLPMLSAISPMSSSTSSTLSVSSSTSPMLSSTSSTSSMLSSTSPMSLSTSSTLPPEPVSHGVPIFRKTVDWSTLNYGITIPVKNRDSFFSALGHLVAPGINFVVPCVIVLDGNDYCTFEASIVHSVFSGSSVVQIRYLNADVIAKELRSIFTSTFDYCNHERSRKGDNSQVAIPFDMEEHISIIVSDKPRSIKFVCSPLQEIAAFEELVVPEESLDMPESDALQEDVDSKELNILVETNDSKTAAVSEPAAEPISITLLGKEYHFTALNDMFMKVCEVMLLHTPYIMAAMDKDTDFNTEARKRFSYIQSEIETDGKRLSNGLWVETDMEHGDIVYNSLKLLEKCGFSADELRIDTTPQLATGIATKNTEVI